MATLHFDGSCKRNPGGPGGWSFVIEGLTKTIRRTGSGWIEEGPEVTNNVAEFRGLIEGLAALAQHADEFNLVTVFGDSRMVIEQANGSWKAKKPHLKLLLAEAREWISLIGRQRMTFRWIPREQNVECDAMSR